MHTSNTEQKKVIFKCSNCKTLTPKYKDGRWNAVSRGQAKGFWLFCSDKCFDEYEGDTEQKI